MATKDSKKRDGVRVDIALADEKLLASLGYKQEFQRAFTGLEVRSSHIDMFRRRLGNSISRKLSGNFRHRSSFH